MTREDFERIVDDFCLEWMNACPSINSVGIGEGPSIQVGLLEAVTGIELPKEYAGLPVRYRVTGEIRAL